MSYRADQKAIYDASIRRAEQHEQAAKTVVRLITEHDGAEPLTAQEILNELRALSQSAREEAAKADANYHHHLLGENALRAIQSQS